MGLFDFVDMIGTHKERKVDNYTKDKLEIDTCKVNDAKQPYETAIKHPEYNNGKWIVLELYDTKEDAQKGHNKWIKIMTSDKLPDELKDVSSAEITELVYITNDSWRVFKRNKGK